MTTKTPKTTVSLTEELENAIGEYNRKHPYDKLNKSQVAQKAFYDFIMAKDPGIFNSNKNQVIESKPLLLENENQVIESKVLLIENENQVKSSERLCANCGNPFTSDNPRKKTCSDKCRTAYNRKKRKST